MYSGESLHFSDFDDFFLQSWQKFFSFSSFFSHRFSFLMQILKYDKKKGKITNNEYNNIYDCRVQTSSSELADLVNKKLLESSGQKGAGSYYILKNG